MSERRVAEEYSRCRVDYEGYKIMRDAIPKVETFRRLPLRRDDVFVASYGRSGTTWLQEIVWLLCNEVDLERAREINISERFPYAEFSLENLNRLAVKTGKRFIKTHLPVELLPEEVTKIKPKILYVARNPKDVLVSYYFFLNTLSRSYYGGTLEDIYTMLNDDTGLGPWWKHVLGYWLLRDEGHVMFLTYEEMTKDAQTAVTKIAEFLGKKLTDEEISKIVEHTKFINMKNNEATNKTSMKKAGLIKTDAETDFMRKGIVGDWRNQLTEEMARSMDKMVEERLHPYGLRFQDPFE